MPSTTAPAAAGGDTDRPTNPYQAEHTERMARQDAAIFGVLNEHRNRFLAHRYELDAKRVSAPDPASVAVEDEASSACSVHPFFRGTRQLRRDLTDGGGTRRANDNHSSLWPRVAELEQWTWTPDEAKAGGERS